MAILEIWRDHGDKIKISGKFGLKVKFFVILFAIGTKYKNCHISIEIEKTIGISDETEPKMNVEIYKKMALAKFRNWVKKNAP